MNGFASVAVKLISPVLIFVGNAVIKLKNNFKVCVFLNGFFPVSVLANECVVLLHGLARISNSMGELESKLSRAGFSVTNVEYPSLNMESRRSRRKLLVRVYKVVLKSIRKVFIS